MIRKYSQRVVVFMDILGFTNMVKNPICTPILFDVIDEFEKLRETYANNTPDQELESIDIEVRV